MADLYRQYVLRQKPTSNELVIVLLYQFLSAVAYRSFYDLVPVGEKCMNIYMLEWYVAHVPRGQILFRRVIRDLCR